MLRLKQCLSECKIPQKAFCDATGRSKTQVSLTLSSGELPANRTKFIDDVISFAHANDKIMSWLIGCGLAPEHLLETTDVDHDHEVAAIVDGGSPLERHITHLIGHALIDGEMSGDLLIGLARCTRQLLGELRSYVKDASELAEIEDFAASLIGGAA
jgi:hypothetical protein